MLMKDDDWVCTSSSGVSIVHSCGLLPSHGRVPMEIQARSTCFLMARTSLTGSLRTLWVH